MEQLGDKRLIDITLGELVLYLDSRYAGSSGNAPHNTAANRFLKVRECAELTGYAEEYIRQLVFKRKIPFSKLNNGALRFSFVDIVEWMESNKRIPTEAAAQMYIDHSKMHHPTTKKIQ